MRLRCSSLQACPVERLADELGRPALLDHLAWPMLTFTPVDPPERTERWSYQPYVFALKLGGRLPLGTHTIHPQPPTGAGRVWHDAGHSGLVRVWDHQVEVADVHGMTRYTDVVELHAGLLTPVAWLFAAVFYRHRQRRLNRLVAAGFDSTAAPDGRI